MLPGLVKEVLWLEMSATRKEYHHDEGFPPNNKREDATVFLMRICC